MRAITISLACSSLPLASVAIAGFMLQGGPVPVDNACDMITSAGGTTTCVASSGSGSGGTNQSALQGGATWIVTTDTPGAWSYLPASVTVPFGETEVVYYGEVSSSAEPGWVSVTVSGGGESKTAYIYIAE